MLCTLIVCLFVSHALAAIKSDFNCSGYFTDGNGDPWRYLYSAENCKNVISDAACKALYPPSVATDPPPTAGEYMDRPERCYTMQSAAPYPIDEGLKAAAIANCPRQCGYCCQTDAFKCSNVQFPRLNCATITKAQCESLTWRTIIAQDCPSACGFCNMGGCVDAVTNCGTDLSICTNVDMQDFVNQYCQKTCNRCPSTTAASSAAATASCTSYIRDSTTACASWAANGFCTNNFYTVVQRKAYCATTCRIC